MARATFDDILGTPESGWIDFKSAPYGLDSDRSRWELAKDISAFANTAGGAIAIGFETETDEASRVETASAPRPTRLDAVRVQAARDVVRNWIYPRVREFEIHWYPYPGNDELVVALFHLPAQREADKPFVVRRMGDGANEKGSVGIAERDGSDTAWWTAERVHHQLQQRGIQPPVDHRPDRGSVSTESVEDRLNNHLRRNEATQGWENDPILHLQAIPPQIGERLSNFYNRDGLWGALNDPPRLRPGGWNLRAPYEPEVEEGALVCQSQDIDVLRLDHDGLFTVSGIASTEFLSWAMDRGRSPSDVLPLNPIALSEWVYSFFMFVNEELKGLMQGQWTYRLVALQFQSANIGLFGGLPRQMFPRSAVRASSDRWIHTFPPDEDIRGRETFGFEGLSAGREAYMALDRLYGLFGLGNDVIPFAQGEELVITAEILDNL